MTHEVPVVVIYRGGHGALAIARTLGRLGVPMYLIAQRNMPTPVWSSRYWRRKAHWDFDAPHERTLEYLKSFGREIESLHGERPILLTLADWVAIFIEDHADDLAQSFTFPRSAGPVVRRLANKWEMFSIARRHEIPTPQTVYPRSRTEVVEYLETATFPVVMKAADPFASHVPAKAIALDANALLEKFDRDAAIGPPNVVLQEFIPGTAESVWMCNAYFDRDGECRAIFSGRKLRQVSSTGIASLAICEPNAAVEAQTIRLMQSAGYRGCVGVGWRYDSRDKQYKLLDVNARVSGVFRLFRATNGMDVVRACYRDLTGQPIPPCPESPGRKWLLEEDILGVIGALRAREMTVWQWLGSLRGVRETQWFAFDDPLPIVRWAWSTFWSLVQTSRWTPKFARPLARRVSA